MRTTKSTAKAKAPAKRTARPRQLKIVKSDEWLRPFEGAIQGRHDHALHKIEELTGGKGSLSDLPMDISISAYIVLLVNGYCESGHPMPQPFTL